MSGARQNQDTTVPSADCQEAGRLCSEPASAVQRVFGLLGKRWTGLVIAALMGGPGHFTELKRAVPGISERMLSDRLSELAAEGLVSREVHGGPPLRVSYRLTTAGEELRTALIELTRWAEAHLEGAKGSCPQVPPAAPDGSAPAEDVPPGATPAATPGPPSAGPASAGSAPDTARAGPTLSR